MALKVYSTSISGGFTTSGFAVSLRLQHRLNGNGAAYGRNAGNEPDSHILLQLELLNEILFDRFFKNKKTLMIKHSTL